MDPEFGEALRSALEDLINDSGTLPAPSAGSHPSQGGSGAPAEPAAPAEARARREADLLATGLDAGLLDPEPAAEAAVEAAPVADPRRHPRTPTSCPARPRPASGPTPS